MRKDFKLRTTETDSTEFRVSYWKNGTGEGIAEGADLLVIESVDEKTALAVPSPYAGVLVEIVAGEDEVVHPGDLLGRIDVE